MCMVMCMVQLRSSKKKGRTLVKKVEKCEEELSKAVDEFESQKREWQQQRDQFRRMILELQQDLEMNIREPRRLKKKIQELVCACVCVCVCVCVTSTDLTSPHLQVVRVPSHLNRPHLTPHPPSEVGHPIFFSQNFLLL